MDKIKEKPQGSSAVREKGADAVRRGLESGADRLRTQLRDAAQRGQRDEYGGDQIEDAAARAPGRAERAAEGLVRGRKRPEKVQFGAEHTGQAGTETPGRTGPQGDTGHPIIKTREAVASTGDRRAPSGGATRTTAPQNTPDNTWGKTAPCTRTDNKAAVSAPGQESQVPGQGQRRPAVKTKETYIRQQDPTPVTGQPQNVAQGTAVFIRERGRQRSADIAGKSTVCRAVDERSPATCLEHGVEADGKAQSLERPPSHSAQAGPRAQPVTQGRQRAGKSGADSPGLAGNVRRGSPLATGRADRRAVTAGGQSSVSIPCQVQKMAERPVDRRPGVIRTKGAGQAGRRAVKTLDRGQHAAGTAARTGRQTDQSAQTVQAVRRAPPARRAAAAAKSGAKKATQRVGSAVKGALAAVRSAAVLLAAGGGVVAAVVLLLCIVGLLLLSPFGIFFASQQQEPGTVPPNGAIAQVNIDLADYLSELQAGDYAGIQLDGQLPDWREVLAVFAVRTTLAEDGVDVLTLDPDRVERLKEVFWDMTAITAQTGETDAGTVLYLTVEAKTADEMRERYSFTDEQNSTLDELLAETELLDGLITDLSVSQADAAALVEALPEDLAPVRRAVVETACSLVGKVNYWWGGKSLTLGWDSRWGSLRKVTADGSVTSGQYRPYGLDCSGFVDWVFYNATGGGYVIGHGGGATAQHSYCEPIDWSQAQPGDLVFYPEDSHVGIVGGWDEDGQLLIIHCASGYNNTVITGLEGFTSIGRPVYYGE